MKDTINNLLLDSTLTQGLVTVVLLGVTGYLVIKGQPVPEVISGSLFTVIGFWFGTKGRLAAQQRLGVNSTSESE